MYIPIQAVETHLLMRNLLRTLANNSWNSGTLQTMANVVLKSAFASSWPRVFADHALFTYGVYSENDDSEMARDHIDYAS